MNKNYMFNDGYIFIGTDKGIVPAIPYVDNIGDILVVENEIEYLEQILNNDVKILNDSVKERKFKQKEKRTLSIVGTVGSLALATFLPAFWGSSNTEIVNTTFGPMTQYLATSATIGTSGVVVSNLLAFVGLSSGTSLGYINAYRERVDYAKELLEILKEELNYLKKNSTTKGIDSVEEMVPYSVNSDSVIELIKENLKLRECFGYNSKRFIKEYNNGTLVDNLIKNNFSDLAIQDFLDFIKGKLSLESENKVVKK